MVEAPKVEVPKIDPKARQPKLRYQDRTEVGETFADSIRVCVFDGQLLRIEFTVTRLDDPGALGILEGRQGPGCRLVVSGTGLVQLLGKVGQVGAAVQKASVIAARAAKPEPGQER